ncbi:MAG: benzoyl-CoA reductase, bzd-type, subunit N [Promethearchaeota archaeon Loki_b32]|nr:MAG: benzoyl-CoA reductase, bzd-type, subunit N [Candidatus Lokiarchaeota archaeon Loki_b32]
MEAISVFEQFKDWYENRHEYAKKWKERTGGKVIGTFCTYVPEEILYAADILPVRILGSHEPQDVSEPHIFAMFCPFCRDCLAQGLKGRFDYLDGITIAQSCLHIRQTFTSWDLHIPVDFTYYLTHPMHIQSPRAIPYLTEELKEFKKAVEEWTGKEITEEDLKRGIEIMNTNRRLLQQVYELRKQPNPPLTGLEAMIMVVSSQMVDKREHNKALVELLEKLPSRSLDEPGERLMILGSEDDDTKFIAMVEDLGSRIVIDEHCTGTRYFYEEVNTNGDALASIAERYVKRIPCPSKDWPERTRVDHIVKLAKEYDIQGAIVMQMKFCDPHELDTPAIKKALENDVGVPTIFLEFDVTVPIGQFKTRVEAFLEILREEDLF